MARSFDRIVIFTGDLRGPRRISVYPTRLSFASLNAREFADGTAKERQRERERERERERGFFIRWVFSVSLSAAQECGGSA